LATARNSSLLFIINYDQLTSPIRVENQTFAIRKETRSVEPSPMTAKIKSRAIFWTGWEIVGNASYRRSVIAIAFPF